MTGSAKSSLLIKAGLGSGHGLAMMGSIVPFAEQRLTGFISKHKQKQWGHGGPSKWNQMIVSGTAGDAHYLHERSL